MSTLGVDRGTGMIQSNHDIEAWELFLKEYKPASIVELGTGSGRFTRWLDDQCHVFKTFDLAEPAISTPGFVQGDIFFQGQVNVRMAIRAAPRPLVLFCDNGDKPKEVKAFAPFLKRGDFLAVHDFGTEIQTIDIVYVRWFHSLGGRGLTRFYKVL